MVILVSLSVVIAATLAGFSSSLFGSYQYEPRLIASASPATPTVLGDRIMISVIDGDSVPIGDAKVEVRQNGVTLFTTSTDETGSADFEYPGMVTQITISKDGYSPALVIVPKVVEKWVFEYATAMIAILSTVGGAIAAFVGLKLFKRKDLGAGMESQDTKHDALRKK